jgi:UPF0042 nucleotide-binding protein
MRGRARPVAEFLDGRDEVRRFLEDVTAFLERWLPSLVRTNRSYVTIAIGCTGGQHRSVYLAERLAAHFEGRFGRALLRHRDLEDRSRDEPGRSRGSAAREAS